MDFLKTIGGKIVGGFVAVAVIAALISWWTMDDATKDMLLSSTGKILAWLGVVALLPWATFFVIGWVAKLESNLAGGLLVFIYTAGEAAVLLWLFDWKVGSPTGWVFFAAAVMLAGVYNLFACDWLAEKVA